MAQPTGITLHVSGLRRLDDLCPDCLTSAMWTCEFVTLGSEGVSTVASRTWCDRCRRE